MALPAGGPSPLHWLILVFAIVGIVMTLAYFLFEVFTPPPAPPRSALEAEVRARTRALELEVARADSEHAILCEIRHPFIVRLRFAFQAQPPSRRRLRAREHERRTRAGGGSGRECGRQEKKARRRSHQLSTYRPLH